MNLFEVVRIYGTIGCHDSVDVWEVLDPFIFQLWQSKMSLL